MYRCNSEEEACWLVHKLATLAPCASEEREAEVRLPIYQALRDYRDRIDSREEVSRQPVMQWLYEQFGAQGEWDSD